MFDRYNIIDEDDLAGGVAQRFNGNGKQAANAEGVETAPDSVTSHAVGA